VKYVVVYTEDGSVVAAAPVDGDKPVVADGEQAVEVELDDEQPDFDQLRFDAESRTFKTRDE